MISWRVGSMVSSMLQSLRRGEPPEIDHLNGFIARKAAEVGLAAPVHARFVELVREIHRGERRSDPRNLAEV
jgi:2-dehydropantoate 2-reductase